MKKVLMILATISIFAGSNAFALSFLDTYWDLNAVDAAEGTSLFTIDDGITEAFSQFQYYADSVSEISATGTIVDSGQAYATELHPTAGSLPVDSEGMGSLYTMTMVWTDLTGQVTSQTASSIDAVYTSGTIDFYIDYNPYALTLGNASTFSDGTWVATAEINSGGYSLSLDGTSGSSYTLWGSFTDIMDDFWFNAATGEDLAGDLLDKDWLIAYSHGDNDPLSVDITYNPNNSITVNSNHDSSFEVAVVPEPSTFLLLGSGLLGLGYCARRRK